MTRGGRGPSNIASASQIRARDKRREAQNAPLPPAVSLDALYGIVDRECEKQGRRWYGVPSADAAIQEIRAADPDTRKIARQMMLDRIDAFPLRVQA
jgi:hypothetical protein